MSTVRVKQHDTKGIFIDVLTLNDIPVDLTGATVRFLMRKPGFAIDQAAEVTSPSGGGVRYQPIPADVREPGQYKQEWEVHFLDDRYLTFPNNSYHTVIIQADLGGQAPE